MQCYKEEFTSQAFVSREHERERVLSLARGDGQVVPLASVFLHVSLLDLDLLALVTTNGVTAVERGEVAFPSRNNKNQSF